MRRDILKRHMKTHEKEPTKNNIFSGLLFEENNVRNNELNSPSTTSVHKPSNLDKERIILKLKIDKTEYTEKLEFGREIYENVIKYTISDNTKINVKWAIFSSIP